MNIVAIDDELPALNLLLEAINEAKPEAEVHGFSDPDELIEYVKSNPVDVACLDIQIYDITGIELAKKYGEDTSSSFINGVLATVVKENNLQ